jgi:hypothetical protein
LADWAIPDLTVPFPTPLELREQIRLERDYERLGAASAMHRESLATQFDINC